RPPRQPRAPLAYRPRRRRWPRQGQALSPWRFRSTPSPEPQRRGRRRSSRESYLWNLAQFQRGEASKREHHGNDPKSDDDGRFRPALLLEMVMQRRHAEDTHAEKLE